MYANMLKPFGSRLPRKHHVYSPQDQHEASACRSGGCRSKDVSKALHECEMEKTSSLAFHRVPWTPSPAQPTRTRDDQKRSLPQHWKVMAAPAASWALQLCRAAGTAWFCCNFPQPAATRMQDCLPSLIRHDRLPIQPCSAVV